MTADLTVVLLDRPHVVCGGERVEPGRGLATAAFTALALRANQVVPRSELVDALWDGAAPAGASNRVYTYVSALRRTFDGRALDGRAPGEGGAAGPDLLESGSSGYRLVVGPDAVDVAVVLRHRDEARAHRGREEYCAELSSIEAALAPWRGEALRGVPGPLAASWRRRLEEIRLGLHTRRAHLMVAAGHAGSVVGVLRDLAAEHPAREDVHQALMAALHRSGRPGAALEVYDEARRVLVERFGTEPGAALRTLRRTVLAASGPDGRGRAPIVPGPACPGGTANLAGRRPPTFVGRPAELDRIGSAVARVREGRGGALWFDGAPGTGKSALIAEGLARGLAGADDCVVGWGTAGADTASVPFGVLRRCLADIDPALPGQIGLTGAHAGGGDRDGARLRLGAVISSVRALLESAGRRPVVMVLDDLHHADDESLLVWRHLLTLAGPRPLLLVAACRPLPRRRNVDLLRVLATESGCGTTALAGLAEDEVVDLLRRRTPGARPGAGLIAAMSAGNPRFAGVIADVAAARSVVAPPVDAPEVVAAVHEHLAGLSGPTRELLRSAARLPNTFTVADVLDASGKRAHSLLNLVDEALTVGVLLDLDGSRLRFRHPVVRRVLGESAPVPTTPDALDPGPGTAALSLH